MIKLKSLLFEAKHDLIASRVWDYVISNEVWINEESLSVYNDIVKNVKLRLADASGFKKESSH